MTEKQLLRRARKLVEKAARHQEEHRCDMCCFVGQENHARDAVILLDALMVRIQMRRDEVVDDLIEAAVLLG